MGVVDNIRAKAKAKVRTIVLPETEDDRVLKAAEAAQKDGLAKIVLLGDKSVIEASAAKLGVNLMNAKIVDPKSYEKLDAYVNELFKLREKKGLTKDQAKELLLTEPRYFGAMMVRLGDADGMVAGSNSPTADVIRASIHVIGTAAGLKTVSSSFLMVVPNKAFGTDGVMMYTDSGAVPNPTSDQLCDIAISASKLGRQLAGLEPKVAFLSFSTKGSAAHPDVDKVTKAVELMKDRKVDFEYDGELQADAALIPSIGQKKAPGSKVAGYANVLVFPDLDAGNISYKLTERLTGGEAYGPLLQGLAKPVNDLSRGCSVEDIVNVIAITSVEVED